MSVNLGPLGQQNYVSAILLLAGAFSLATVAYNIGRVLLSTFVLPGQSVSRSVIKSLDSAHHSHSSLPSDPKAHGLLSLAHQMDWEKSLLHSWRPRVST